MSLFFVLQAEKVYNQDMYFKKTVKYVGEPMSQLESISSSAVSSGAKEAASVRLRIHMHNFYDDNPYLGVLVIYKSNILQYLPSI